MRSLVGPEDRARVGQYLDTVREVERRIQAAEAQTAEVRCRISIHRRASPRRTPITRG